MQVKHYPSAWACAKAVLREEGVQGFFRGVTIPLITITFVRTSSFSIYTSTKNMLDKYFPSPNKSLTRIAFAGAIGGITSGTLISCGSAPFELVKVQRQLEFLINMQKQQNARAAGRPLPPFQRQSGFQAALEIYRNRGGLRGFYMGFSLHMARDMSGSGACGGVT